ncbi:uncharacterized protein [Clytia hemisphaerica]|uniref:uncharacterized protein n=1 Tax=Clytia hemisphaerica TaxID=252671 RepID=UPI0034D5ECE4
MATENDFTFYLETIFELDTEISQLVRERSSSYVKEGESFLSGSVTEGGFIPRFMATNELELDEMNTIGHIPLSESQTFLESIDGYPGYFRLRSCDELYQCLTAHESVMYEWLHPLSEKYFRLPTEIMQHRKEAIFEKSPVEVSSTVQGPSLNTHTMADLDALQKGIANLVKAKKNADTERVGMPPTIIQAIGNTELPSKMWSSSMDFVLCFKLHFWPACASRWFNEKHDWISQETLNKIKQDGCHLVPKPIHRRVDIKSNEWRISFSVAEKTLSAALTRFQKKCYLVSKMIFYQQFKALEDSITERHLPSYVLKTIKFKIQDLISKTEWEHYESNGEIVGIISVYYKELSTCLKNGTLSCYFMDEMNILDGYSEDFLQKCKIVATEIADRPIDFLHRHDLQAVLELKRFFSFTLVPEQLRDNDADALSYHEFNLWLGQLRSVQDNLLEQPDTHVWFTFMKTLHKSKKNCVRINFIKPDLSAELEKLKSPEFLRDFFTRHNRHFNDGYSFYYERLLKEQKSLERSVNYIRGTTMSTIDTSYRSMRKCYMKVWKYVIKCHTELKYTVWERLFSDEFSRYLPMIRDSCEQRRLTEKDLITIADNYCTMTMPNPEILPNDAIIKLCYLHLAVGKPQYSLPANKVSVYIFTRLFMWFYYITSYSGRCFGPIYRLFFYMIYNIFILNDLEHHRHPSCRKDNKLLQNQHSKHVLKPTRPFL